MSPAGAKRHLGPVNALYPSLTTIVGTMVDGRANWVTVAHVGIMNHGTPQYLSFGLNKQHHTNKGIFEHREFSVNIPSRELMVETDYVGLVSGRNTDKSGLFEVLVGVLPNAPMIAACPVCMQCRLHQVVDFPSHDVFVGEVVATYADEAVLDGDGKVDVRRVAPLLFDMATVRYYGLGPELGRCWSAGKALKHKG